MNRVPEGRNSCNRAALAPGIIAISSPYRFSRISSRVPFGAREEMRILRYYVLFFLIPAVETAGYRDIVPSGL